MAPSQDEAFTRDSKRNLLHTETRETSFWFMHLRTKKMRNVFVLGVESFPLPRQQCQQDDVRTTKLKKKDVVINTPASFNSLLTKLKTHMKRLYYNRKQKNG